MPAILLISIILTIGLLIFVVSKIKIAYSHCEGGAPVVDIIFGVPALSFFSLCTFTRQFRLHPSVPILGTLALTAITGAACFIAWQLGNRKTNPTKKSTVPKKARFLQKNQSH